MPETKRPLKVFLCHARSDAAAVLALHSRLKRDGVDAWLDKEKLIGGQDWEFEIRKAVREADVVIVCLSKQFNQAGFRQKEVRWAYNTAMEQPEGEIFIIPARLEDCETLESLRKWHWVDLFEESGYEKLFLALEKRAQKIGAETLRFYKASRFLEIPFQIYFRSPLVTSFSEELFLGEADSYFLSGVYIKAQIRRYLQDVIKINLLNEQIEGRLFGNVDKDSEGDSVAKLVVPDVESVNKIEPSIVTRIGLDRTVGASKGKLPKNEVLPAGSTFKGKLLIANVSEFDPEVIAIRWALISIEQLGGMSTAGYGSCSVSLTDNSINQTVFYRIPINPFEFHRTLRELETAKTQLYEEFTSHRELSTDFLGARFRQRVADMFKVFGFTIKIPPFEEDFGYDFIAIRYHLEKELLIVKFDRSDNDNQIWTIDLITSLIGCQAKNSAKGILVSSVSSGVDINKRVAIYSHLYLQDYAKLQNWLKTL
jgi:hypothetical protein